MTSKNLSRFGVSMEESLLERFDQLIEEKGYKTRSEAVRDLVREKLVQQKWEQDDQEVAGCLLLFYDHHQRHLMGELTTIQHDYHDAILATTHFHLDHHNCLEMIVVRGNAQEIRTLRDKLLSLKGVKYGELSVSPVSEP
ncbi:nickel responsive regulator [Neobacillus bataviensis LMG 21833]|uniref:Putative nickel-responsive regulator n=1 Tax=Neobacillus bataviensis LMG 21833 TaxID=1117379 RepID=K6ED59_9BACI|nr:nickel-responsive transcriptional regulator NikR [Neobacillus bataviensis]EKN71396.1 nickel responsive regulator [Neobacillus bataviensis LMG 21833]